MAKWRRDAGWTDRAGFPPGRLLAPHDAIFLQSGDIMVAEWYHLGRITMLRQMA